MLDWIKIERDGDSFMCVMPNIGQHIMITVDTVDGLGVLDVTYQGRNSRYMFECIRPEYVVAWAPWPEP